MTVGWKVLDPHRMSCLSVAGRVHYGVNEVTTPKKSCGPLCVFSTREYAAEFVKKMRWRELRIAVKCEYQPSRELNIWHNKLREIGIPYLPIGTVLADSVTCLE